MQQPYTIVFMGRSGSGKGTQLELLGKYFADTLGLPVVSLDMGSIFRSFFKGEGYVHDIARDVSMEQGKFQPDFLTNALFVHGAVNIIDEKSPLFVDGYPRRMGQLETLKQLLEYSKRTNAIVINIEVSSDSVRGRMLLRGRGDDGAAKIDSRLKEYDTNVVPVIEAIQKDPFFTYFEINGEPTIEEIHKDIVSKLGM